MFKKIRHFAKKHKVYSGIIVAAVLAGGYFGYQKLWNGSAETRYVLTEARRAPLAVSVSGSGQVSPGNQVEVKAKASGEALSVYAVAGKFVQVGASLATLDASDADKSVRDAELALQNAKIAYEKVKGPDGAAVPRLKEQAAADLARAYDDGFNSVANAFIDLPSLLTNFENLLTDETLDKSQENISWYANQILQSEETARRTAESLRDAARAGYEAAEGTFDDAFLAYQNATRASSRASLEALIAETYEAVKTTADAVKTMGNYIDFTRDFMENKKYAIPVAVGTHQSSLNSYTGTLNGHLTKLLSGGDSIVDAKDAYTDADLDLESQALSVRQKENSLADAKEKRDDYTVRAPFSGIVAKVDVDQGDDVSSGMVVATLITTRKIAEISLNEVDAARVSLGQKASLSFDAASDVKADGVVSEVDTVGTMSQGVVSYIAKISFALTDSRIKPGMSVTAEIVTDAKDGVLVVPNSAIKTMNGRSFVEVADDAQEGALRNPTGVALLLPPRRAAVETGLADDEVTEILSGLNEGETVVVRTLTDEASTPAVNNNNPTNAFRVPSQGGTFRR